MSKQQDNKYICYTLKIFYPAILKLYVMNILSIWVEMIKIIFKFN